MTTEIDRAIQLYNLHQYDLALSEINKVLTEEPQNSRALGLRALALMQKHKDKEAKEAALQAVSINPEDDHLYYILSLVHIRITGNSSEAEKAITEALRLNPQQPDYYALLALLKIDEHRFKEALALCRSGLSIDPQHADCLSTQAQILTKMGKKKQAKNDIQQVLQKDPQNPRSLASSGWIHLEAGDNKNALKLDPGYEYARKGLLQALKAKSPFFRLYLKYILWANGLGRTSRILLSAGIYIFIHSLRLLPGEIVLPFLGLYLLFIASIWLTDPIFNVFLRFDKFGKYALTRGESISSTAIAVLTVLSIVCGVFALVFNQTYIWVINILLLAMTFLVAIMSSRLASKIDNRIA